MKRVREVHRQHVAHLDFVRLRSDDDTDAWLASV